MVLNNINELKKGTEVFIAYPFSLPVKMIVVDKTNINFEHIKTETISEEINAERNLPFFKSLNLNNCFFYGNVFTTREECVERIKALTAERNEFLNKNLK